MFTSIFKSKSAEFFIILYLGFSILISLSISQVLFAQNVVNDTTEVTANLSQDLPNEIPTDAPSIAHGNQLFGQHCSACHMVEKQLIGPALASVHNRRPIPWLIQFIKNSQYVIAETDDEYAKQLFSQYNEVLMPQFEFLSNDDIISILAYIKAESVSPTSSGGVNGVDEDYVTRPQEEYADPDGENTYAQDADEAEINPNSLTGMSITLLIVFGLSFMALIISAVYIFKERRKNKKKENA